jgi:hypothetical protein
MKGCQEAMHPVPIVVLFDLMFDHSLDHWLVCKSVHYLVHLLVCLLIPQIKSNNLPQQDFQRLSSD